MPQEGNYIGRLVPEGFLLRSQAAERLGISYDTLREWEATGKIIPTAYMEAGTLSVPLYDIPGIEALAKELK